MPNRSLDIISEEDFIAADHDTSRRWNHKLLVAIFSQNAEAALQQKLLDEKLESVIRNAKLCPGRNYRPVVDKVLVGAMGLIGGFLAVILALKARIIETVSSVQ